MGQSLSRIANTLSALQKKRLLMLGLDYSGKTSLLLKMLHFDEVARAIPTIGCHVERVEYKNMDMSIWDMSDQSKLRPLWRHYYAGTDAVMFVIDSCDQKRLEEARDRMLSVLADPNMHGCCTILIFLNKQDLPGAISPNLMIDKLALDSADAEPLQRRKWHMQACSAKTGEGVHKGLDWLSDALSKEKAKPTSG